MKKYFLIVMMYTKIKQKSILNTLYYELHKKYKI
jgi:hypothetical protein